MSIVPSLWTQVTVLIRSISRLPQSPKCARCRGQKMKVLCEMSIFSQTVSAQSSCSNTGCCPQRACEEFYENRPKRLVILEAARNIKSVVTEAKNTCFLNSQLTVATQNFDTFEKKFGVEFFEEIAS